MFRCKDWEKTKARMEAFWEREIVDRCCLRIETRLPGMEEIPFPEDAKGREDYWLDGEWLYKRNMNKFEHTYFAADEYANLFTNFGVGSHAAFFKGANYGFEQSTMWFFPTIDDWEKDEFALDESNYYFNRVIEAVKYLNDRNDGSYVVSQPDMCGNLDALAHLRGSANLLMDMFEEEPALERATAMMQEQYVRANKTIYEIVREKNDGGSIVGWMAPWAPGFTAQMQCDLSVMISNETFEKYAMPELRAQCDLLDYPIYHFDGIEQIRHLDSLLSLEKLRMIQWTHVDGQPKPYNYMETLQKIQAAGKCLLLLVDAADIEVYMENLSSKGLFIQTSATSKEEADAIVRKVEKLTRE